MTERDSIELLINIQAKGQDVLASLAKTTKGVEDADKGATKATTELKKALDQQAASAKTTEAAMAGAMLRANLLAEGILRVAGAVKDYTTGAAQYAARTEQVSAVMDNLARVNGMNTNSVRMQANAIKELGITTQESRNIINMMIGSQLDLGKSLELTRMAQNAAKVAGINSSEALQRMVYAITSGQPEMLRTLGIAVSFENAYQRAAKAAGVSAISLDEQTKLNIRLNAVLQRGPLIDGSYVMSLTTAAGQMQSLQRYTDDLKNSLGQGLQPALLDVVTGMERLTKFAQENVDTFQQMTAGVSALGVAGAVFAATPFLPLPYRAGVAGAAGVGTYALMNQDAAQANTEKYQGAFKKLEDQRKTMAHQLELGLIDDAAFKRFSDQLPKFRELLRARFIEEQAELFKQRTRKLGNINVFPEGMRDRFDLGAGVSVGWGEIESVMKGGQVKFDKSGLVAHNPGMNTPTAGDDKALEKRNAAMRDLLHGLEDKGLDPLARLFSDTQRKLAELVSKYGPLTNKDIAYIDNRYDRSFAREWAKGSSAPQPVEIDRDTLFFRGMRLSGLPQTPQMVGVDPQRNEAAITTLKERQVAAIQRAAQHQQQMVRLIAGPGGEIASLNTAVNIRIDAAQREFAITKDRARLEAEIDQARKDRLLAIAQMQQAELEKYRQAAGSVYDAMVQKGMSGIGDVIKGQLHVIGRTVFQNLAVEVFRTAKDSMKLGDMIGGQVDPKTGKLTTLGRVLQGSPLGVDQSRLALEVNTNETRLNTQALKELSAVFGTGGGSAVGLGGSPAEVMDSMTTGKAASRLQRIVGTTMAIGAGAYGVVQGVQQGGVRGALNAGAGVAGMAAGLISSKLLGASLASGPLAPILAGAAIAIPLITSMFGQNKEKFDKEQTETLNRNRYEAPTAANRVSDIRGADVDYDFTGRLRTVNERPIIFQINAVDAKSFLDRSGDIAEALHKELRMGHRVGLDIQQAILGA